MNELVRVLDLTKIKSEILGSRLQQWNLIDKGVKISTFGERSKELIPLFGISYSNLVACNDVSGLFRVLGIIYDPTEWRLIIDGSSTACCPTPEWEQVTLHPVRHAVEMKETYEKVKQLLIDNKYDQHKWKICCDMNMVPILLGLQTLRGLDLRTSAVIVLKF